MIQQLNQGMCKAAVETGDGYFTNFHFSEAELNRIRELVENHWRSVIERSAPELAGEVKQRSIDTYHEISDRLDHGSLWGKKTRILSGADCAEISKMSLFEYLRSEFGDFRITDDEGSGYGEVYWRLVRPGADSDIGPMHADNWFWKLGHGEIPPDGQSLGGAVVRTRQSRPAGCPGFAASGMAVLRRDATRFYETANRYRFRVDESDGSADRSRRRDYIQRLPVTRRRENRGDPDARQP